MRPTLNIPSQPPDDLAEIGRMLETVNIRTEVSEMQHHEEDTDVPEDEAVASAQPADDAKPSPSTEANVATIDVTVQVEATNTSGPILRDWSDANLEEVSRLGEGAGGAVHSVKDKRTGKMMARKTITTREAPMKQLLRELEIISSTAHNNIILFHGAYMSPSSSEVKILMEYCVGGSLEAVSKQIRQKQARVSEKVAGRIAEGVSAFHFRNIVL